MLNSFNSVLTIFIMIGTGFILTKKGLFTKETSKLFSKIVINVSLPLMMIVNIPMRFSKEKLSNSVNGITVAFFSIIITYIIAVWLCKILKIDKSKKGIVCTMIAFSNSIFIGLPVNIALHGEESATYVFLFYIANTCLFWTMGVTSIRSCNPNKSNMFTGIKSVRKIFSPPLIGFIIGITLVLVEINLPVFIVNSFRYIGNLTTPLSMFFIGTIIYSINFKNIKLDACSYMVFIGRFLIAPLIMFVSLKVFQLPVLLNKVFIIESAMPIITQAALVSDFYDTNSDYAALLVGLSTVLSMLIIPIYSLIF
ncbi:AEC family transporter [Oceanirhabdus sp. W0125-5]|uniref:AEC family transporter n=1 Tax=Oceanirhabdus sp. W0125-5 TaxID=2999116 RepID=UPI0022F2BA0B|nr:AEC family transporter [Oceanirhabdus sp. W0125-5]WBW99088.1 AEC family transporter [Oceanirhabdus sp. W0125-5]